MQFRLFVSRQNFVMEVLIFGLNLVSQIFEGDLISFLKRVNKKHLCEFDVGIIVLQLTAAVQFLQTIPGIIHRDIKPENILIKTETDGSGKCTPLAKLADFGLSCLVEKKEAAMRTMQIGTLQYMAPEMLMVSHFKLRT